MQQLNCLLLDDNPMVVANSIAALVEIQEGHCGDIIDSRSLPKILAALDACTE